MPGRSRKPPPDGTLRIIAGCWRGRKLRFPAIDGLRPTPDRVRETLFNWLSPVIPGARCLDLFSGSGALGIEALSRGASEAVFVEHDFRSARRLQENLDLLRAQSGQVVQAEVLAWLQGPSKAFDIIMLDPPFDSDLLTPACRLLDSGNWLAQGARIYLEAGRGQIVDLPPTWQIVKEKRAGRVVYRVCCRIDTLTP